MMIDLTSSPFFSITLCIIAYQIGIWIQSKVKFALANPLLIATVLVIAVLLIFDIPLANFNKGGDIITLFLGPATAALAISMYSQLQVLKKYLLPMLAGTLAGSLFSVVSIYFLSQWFGLDEVLTASLIPKSVTTPIAIGVSQSLGGLVPVTVMSVVFTGLVGAVFSPLLIRLFRLENPVVIGLAIGTSSHALGTSKAIEMGEVHGAVSGIAIGLAGLFTVVIALFL